MEKILCQECGREIVEEDFYETCRVCGKLFCLLCIKSDGAKYSCMECIVNH
ncbi:hypothetical protein P378_10855 [Desulforamulus profundi]|uniref:Uncharacterized protein n=1 Tax=Desulforamulus profundi TaxID=1383067 RepID=A0A2C6MF71_9FIRM|nr:hypothetical protein [Desulforamulus profundi]PHJ38322.1 hypothetical protein P378_10855 [Desulforamulus profundi]